MIIYSKLGKKGNLGNQLFQIASTLGIAEANNQEAGFPRWEYSNFFENNLPKIDKQKDFIMIKEPSFNYNDLVLRGANYDLDGWYQSEKYFKIQQIRKYFKFKESLIQKIKIKYSFLLNSEHILISVRRGDFVHHPYYFQLSYKYYFLAILENFPDWKLRKLIFTSDDINYCKKHFAFLENSYFLDDLKPVEQLVFGYLSKDFIISNSTFSWWLAWFGEKEDSIIIRPQQNFRGDFAKRNNDKDYFPERWVQFKTSKNSISLNYIGLILKGDFFRIIDYSRFF
ncbi:alpha-1,2-fucosyltransferase, partial [Christiangramia marina]|uniref:alpha-1,2-fucosyltransferase n=1 Tax=Christiangramia marina TaxID=409436 RepID=UPI003AA8CA5E